MEILIFVLVAVLVGGLVLMSVVRERRRRFAQDKNVDSLAVPKTPLSKETSSAPDTTAEVTSANYWDNAIAAAEGGRQAEALSGFRRAIESDPSYYVSVIQPRGALARACWQKAVEQYVQEANAKAATNKAVDGRCGTCGKDVGVDWHYDFESIVFAKTVGTECPECGLFLCDEHLEFGADGNYKPCPKCNARMFTLNLGPAYSSMVDQAHRERRYRGPIKEPSVLSRTFKIG